MGANKFLLSKKSNNHHMFAKAERNWPINVKVETTQPITLSMSETTKFIEKNNTHRNRNQDN